MAIIVDNKLIDLVHTWICFKHFDNNNEYKYMFQKWLPSELANLFRGMTDLKCSLMFSGIMSVIGVIVNPGNTVLHLMLYLLVK